MTAISLTTVELLTAHATLEDPNAADELTSIAIKIETLETIGPVTHIIDIHRASPSKANTIAMHVDR